MTSPAPFRDQSPGSSSSSSKISNSTSTSSSSSILPAFSSEKEWQKSGRDAELQQQLTQLLRQQPYKPTKTNPADLEVNLVHFVQKGPQGRFYLQRKPW
jgi:hypothetical protein